MNMIMLLPIALVLCAYFWSGSPQVLKKNKELLLGILFGYSICYFMDNKLVEGINCNSDEDCTNGENVYSSQPIFTTRPPLVIAARQFRT